MNKPPFDEETTYYSGARARLFGPQINCKMFFPDMRSIFGWFPIGINQSYMSELKPFLM